MNAIGKSRQVPESRVATTARLDLKVNPDDSLIPGTVNFCNEGELSSLIQGSLEKLSPVSSRLAILESKEYLRRDRPMKEYVRLIKR